MPFFAILDVTIKVYVKSPETLIPFIYQPLKVYDGGVRDYAGYWSESVH